MFQSIVSNITVHIFNQKCICFGPSWSWSYGSWIYNYLCNQCLSLQSCEFEPRSWRGVLDTTWCDI